MYNNRFAMSNSNEIRHKPSLKMYRVLDNGEVQPTRIYGQSLNMCRYVIHHDPSELRYASYQDLDMCLYAINKDIRFFRYVQIKSLQRVYDSTKIEKVYVKICMEAIHLRSFCIKYVADTYKSIVYDAAFNMRPDVIRCIDNPSNEIYVRAVSLNPDAIGYIDTEVQLANPELCTIAVKSCPHLLKKCVQTLELCIDVVTASPSCLYNVKYNKFSSTDYIKICEAAINNDGGAIVFVKNDLLTESEYLYIIRQSIYSSDTFSAKYKKKHVLIKNDIYFADGYTYIEFSTKPSNQITNVSDRIAYIKSKCKLSDEFVEKKYS